MKEQAPQPTVVVGDDDTPGVTSKIRLDAEDRFCMNDLHRAAGGAPKHRPDIYLALEQTQELIMALSERSGSRSPVPVKASGDPNGLTFVTDDLAIGYTMWISPRTHLAVLHAFMDEKYRQVAGEADITSTVEMLQTIMDSERESSGRTGRAKPH